MRKKLIAMLILLYIWIPVFASIENYSEDKVDVVEIKDVWMIRPLATIGAAYLGAFEIVYEGLSVIHDKTILTAITTAGFVGKGAEYTYTGLNLGLQYNITGRGIEGVYIGIYPGLSWILEGSSSDSVFLFTTMAELGFQRLDGSFAWGGFIGCSYIARANSLQFKWGLKIGAPFRSKVNNSK